MSHDWMALINDLIAESTETLIKSSFKANMFPCQKGEYCPIYSPYLGLQWWGAVVWWALV